MDAELTRLLRQGKIDLALTVQGADLLSRDFYARKLATVRSLIALPVSHRFADANQVSLSQLKGETFLRVSDDVVPGYTQRIIQFCRECGGFCPRLVSIDGATGLVEEYWWRFLPPRKRTHRNVVCRARDGEFSARSIDRRKVRARRPVDKKIVRRSYDISCRALGLSLRWKYCSQIHIPIHF
jgi:hypothetical protein